MKKPCGSREKAKGRRENEELASETGRSPLSLLPSPFVGNVYQEAP
jgi:hypothetical protein